MSTEKMREEFEAWANDRFEAPEEALKTWRTDESPDHGYPYRSGSDEVDLAIGSAWIGWQASRAALVVELPLPPKAQRSDEEATFSAGGCDMLRKCQKAIESAGITVKP